MTDVNNNGGGENLEQQLNQAAEALITGDSDDPPLSDQAVMEMLTMASYDRKLRSI